MIGLRADNYYAKLHTEKKAHLLRESLNDLEATLRSGSSPECIAGDRQPRPRKELQTHFNGEQIVVLLDGTELKLSRSRREELQNKLKISRR